MDVTTVFTCFTVDNHTNWETGLLFVRYKSGVGRIKEVEPEKLFSLFVTFKGNTTFSKVLF
jgi:hypothetical protein